jgi:hypothetical protein
MMKLSLGPNNFFAIFGTFGRYVTNLRGTFVENVKKSPKSTHPSIHTVPTVCTGTLQLTVQYTDLLDFFSTIFRLESMSKIKKPMSKYTCFFCNLVNQAENIYLDLATLVMENSKKNMSD